jgi:hypothetical protein
VLIFGLCPSETEVEEMMGVTDAMLQYEKSMEPIIKHKPKRGKPYGVKQPDARNIVAALAVIFFISVLIAEFM